MARAISLRDDFDAAALRQLAKNSKNGPQIRRLLSLAASTTAPRVRPIGGVGLQIIRDWVLRFHARGADGLLDGKAPGRPPNSTLHNARRSPA